MADKHGPGFEGPEKKIEIDFKQRVGLKDGLFLVSDELWQKLLDVAHCTIIGAKKSDNCRMYILSESSLFIYRRRLVIKTCGITTLLDIVPALLSLTAATRNDWNATLAEPLGLEKEYMSFSRKNFLWPERQPKPHGTFRQEIDFLTEHFEDGSGYVLGPLNKEHWNFFLADYTEDEDSMTNPPDQTLEVIMSGLSKQAMSHFFNEDGTKTPEGVTAASGIDAIIPGSSIDAAIFEPCGYSMNGLSDDKYYWTIHVTPEDHCSYVSFETNLPMSDYTGLVERVVSTFEPTQCVVTLFADDHSPSSPIPSKSPLPYTISGMKMQHKTSYEFGAPYKLLLVDFIKEGAGKSPL